MRNIFIGIGVALAHAVVLSAVGFFSWFTSLYQNYLYLGLSFVIFFAGAYYFGSKIFLPTLTAYIFLAFLATVGIGLVAAEAVVAMFAIRAPHLLLSIVVVIAALSIGVWSHNLSQK